MIEVFEGIGNFVWFAVSEKARNYFKEAGLLVCGRCSSIKLTVCRLFAKCRRLLRGFFGIVACLCWCVGRG